MNNCTCGVKFTGGLCSSWCDSLKPMAVGMPIRDVSGTCFIPGVTNFTAENLYDATLLVDIGNHISLPVEMFVHPAVRSRICKNNLLDFYADGTERFQGVILHQKDMGKTGNVFDTLIQQGSLKIILRTREA